jgi:hypothetical protein
MQSRGAGPSYHGTERRALPRTSELRTGSAAACKGRPYFGRYGKIPYLLIWKSCPGGTVKEVARVGTGHSPRPESWLSTCSSQLKRRRKPVFCELPFDASAFAGESTSPRTFYRSDTWEKSHSRKSLVNTGRLVVLIGSSQLFSQFSQTIRTAASSGLRSLSPSPLMWWR